MDDKTLLELKDWVDSMTFSEFLEVNKHIDLKPLLTEILEKFGGN